MNIGNLLQKSLEASNTDDVDKVTRQLITKQHNASMDRKRKIKENKKKD